MALLIRVFRMIDLVGEAADRTSKTLDRMAVKGTGINND